MIRTTTFRAMLVAGALVLPAAGCQNFLDVNQNPNGPEWVRSKTAPITVRLIFFIPIFQTLLFGYAIDCDVKNLRTVSWTSAAPPRAAISSRT